MQLQSISDTYPDAISITQVRRDIDALTSLLKKYPVIKVMKGHEVLFKAQRPETEEEKTRKIRLAVQSIRQMRDSQIRKKGKKSLTQILIKERDKMASGSYEV